MQVPQRWDEWEVACPPVRPADRAGYVGAWQAAPDTRDADEPTPPARPIGFHMPEPEPEPPSPDWMLL